MGKTLVAYYSASNNTERVAEQIAQNLHADLFEIVPTEISFATSTSSGLGQSGELLRQMSNGGNWQTGQRFRSGASGEEITRWTDSL